MKRKAVSAVFDRKKEVPQKGKGKVEIVIRLSRNIQKRIILDTLTPGEWEEYQYLPYLQSEISKYEKIVSAMETFNQEMTVENFNAHIGVVGKAYKKKEEPLVDVATRPTTHWRRRIPYPWRERGSS